MSLADGNEQCVFSVPIAGIMSHASVIPRLKLSAKACSMATGLRWSLDRRLEERLENDR